MLNASYSSIEGWASLSADMTFFVVVGGGGGMLDVEVQCCVCVESLKRVFVSYADHKT